MRIRAAFSRVELPRWIKPPPSHPRSLLYVQTRNMNHEAKKVLDSRMEEVKRLGGEDAYRLHALQHLQLKTVVKESHSSPVHALCFNHTAPGLQNLFATVGRDQATVYDDQHMADHLGVVVHLHNQPSQHAPGGELQAACWLSAEGWSPHPHGDALLVVSGGDANISVISAVEARVVVLLRGHDKEVVELAGAAGQPGLLASLSRDGNLRLWDAREEVCLSSVQADATCMALAPDGGAVVVGTARGRLVRYEVGVNEQGRRSIREGSKAELQLQGTTHSEVVDCIVSVIQIASCVQRTHLPQHEHACSCNQATVSLARDSAVLQRFLPGNLLATKSGDGRMFVWCLDAMKAVAAWKVPGCSPSGGFNSRCQFAATPDGKYISVVSWNSLQRLLALQQAGSRSRALGRALHSGCRELGRCPVCCLPFGTLAENRHTLLFAGQHCWRLLRV